MPTNATLPLPRRLLLRRIVAASGLVLAAGVGYLVGDTGATEGTAHELAPNPHIRPKGFTDVDDFEALRLPFPAIRQDPIEPREANPIVSG